MKTFHQICKAILSVAILNFVLFVCLGLVSGGYWGGGEFEGVHYYLVNHGERIEVAPILYWLSTYHGYSVIVTHLSGMLMGFLYGITGGRRYSSASATYLGKSDENSIIRVARRGGWKAVDFCEEIIWILLDRWRKPDGECFVRQSREECVQDLKDLNDYCLATDLLEQPVYGSFSGKHFCLRKSNDSFWVRDGGIHPVVTGRFTSTPRGIYLRMWHRFSTLGIAFLTVWFGTVLGGLTLYGFGRYLLSRYPEVNSGYLLVMSALVVLPLFYGIVLLLSLQIGAAYGYKKDQDIIRAVKSILVVDPGLSDRLIIRGGKKPSGLR